MGPCTSALRRSVIYAGSTCETQIYDTEPCSTHYDKAAGIAVLIALAGFFLLPALRKA